MSAPIYVSGVLGLCCVVFLGPTRAHAAIAVPCTGSVSGVLGLLSRTRRRDVFVGQLAAQNKPHATTKNLNKPNTLNTHSNNSLISLGFKRVGFVLGLLILCWVSFLEGLQ